MLNSTGRDLSVQARAFKSKEMNQKEDFGRVYGPVTPCGTSAHNQLRTGPYLSLRPCAFRRQIALQFPPARYASLPG